MRLPATPTDGGPLLVRNFAFSVDLFPVDFKGLATFAGAWRIGARMLKRNALCINATRVNSDAGGFGHPTVLFLVAFMSNSPWSTSTAFQPLQVQMRDMARKCINAKSSIPLTPGGRR
jgi:hypothetical protein